VSELSGATAEKERAATINAVVKALQFSPTAPNRGGAVLFRLTPFISMGSDASFTTLTKGGLLTKHLGIDYEWGMLDNAKAYAKATMDKKIANIVRVYEEHIGKEAKIYDTPRKPNEYLGKHDGEPVEIEKYRSLVGQIMFFTIKLGLKLGNSTRALSGFMSNPNELHWIALGQIR